MSKKNNIFFITIIIIFIIILIFLLFNNNSKKDMLVELDVDKTIEKIKNKESFVLCISSTTCSHCADYRPKLNNIGKKYDIELYYIDIDKYNEIKQDELKKYISIDKSTPVTAFIKYGEEKSASNRIYGNVSSEKIIERLEKNGFIKK